MQLSNIFVPFVLAMAVAADQHGHQDNDNGGGGGGNSTVSQCRQMAKLTKATQLAANDTELAQKFHNNQTKIDAFKAMVSAKSANLTALQSNTTLMGACATIQAHDAAVGSCFKMAKWEKMSAIAANQTELSSIFKGNATKISDFQAKVNQNAPMLTQMQSNTTLTQFCAVQNDTASCKAMANIQKEQAMANNQTWLDAKFHGDTQKEQKFKDQVAKAATKLNAMMANQTLMSTCNTLTQDGTIGGTTKSASSGNTKSAAGHIEVMGGFITMVAVATAFFML